MSSTIIRGGRTMGERRRCTLHAAALFAIVLLLAATVDAAAMAKKPQQHKQQQQQQQQQHGDGSGRHRQARREPAAAAALAVRIAVAQPASFDPRLQAAFAAGITSHVATPQRSAWVAAAAHRAAPLSPAPPAASRRSLLKAGAGAASGVEYAMTFVIRAPSRSEAESVRDDLVDALNGGGLCSLRMDGGVRDVCEHAADYAELDQFDPTTALRVASASAKPAPVPIARGGGSGGRSGSGNVTPEAPPCRFEGQACDGAVTRCCSWGFQECDLRPLAPTFGTCRSLTGPSGRTCARDGDECADDFECCPHLKCAAAAAAKGAPKRCTFAPEHEAVAVNVTAPVGSLYDAEVQRAVASALRLWLVSEGLGGAETAHVVGYEPQTLPANATWDAERTYRFEYLLSARSQRAAAATARGAAAALAAAGGDLCRVPMAAQGPRENVCSVAAARCAEARRPNKPCPIRALTAQIEPRGAVAPDYKRPSCRKEKQSCAGPFNVAGDCCAGQMCTFGVAGDPIAVTGVCRPKCVPALGSCERDSDCCGYWGKATCSKQFFMCLPADMNVTAVGGDDSAGGASSGKADGSKASSGSKGDGSKADGSKASSGSKGGSGKGSGKGGAKKDSAAQVLKS